MWSTLALLLLFGAVIGISADECTPYELPAKGTCEYTIKWMVNTDKDALSTCLEYFPTTFVKGKVVNGHAHCTVTAAYTCAHLESKHPGVFVMYDKCYYFPKKDGVYVKGTIAEYKADSNKLCEGGKLSVFYSHSHSKAVGMRANSLKIDKLWIGITADGRTIEGSQKMMHKKLWKTIEGEYWAGDELKKVEEKDKDQNYIYPPEAEYFFLRTRTDYVMKRIQGSFERTTKAMQATFACEFESKYAADAEWYCVKLGKLGIDAVYDNKRHDKSRCLYLSANKYTFTGNPDDLKNIKGCQENPSALHSAGMDDGSGDPAKYYKLKAIGEKLRLAGYLSLEKKVQQKCKGVVTDQERERVKIFLPWRHLDHHGNTKFATASTIKWDPKYPLNECSDFTKESTTMGLKNGLKIDMPPELRARAVCSIKFFQECENKKPCGSTQECTNKNTFQTNTNSLKNKEGFFTCKCPGPYSNDPVAVSILFNEMESNEEKTCHWKPEHYRMEYCAWLDFSGGIQSYLNANKHVNLVGPGQNDKLRQVVVREGCKVIVRAASKETDWNVDIVPEVGYGTHDVPCKDEETLDNTWEGMGASSAECNCG